MAEGAAAAIAGNHTVIDMNDLGRGRWGGAVRHGGDLVPVGGSDAPMIAISPVCSTAPHPRLPRCLLVRARLRRWRRTAALLALPLWLAACAAHLVPAGPPIGPPTETLHAFVMPDGTRLATRVWRPAGPPRAIVLALHGMDDSRDAWEVPAPAFTRAGVEIVAPDQRGFGATRVRGYWPGTRTLVSDARHMALLLAARHPHTPLFLMGESMGAAVLMCLAAAPDPPPVAGYILVSPAVWGRDQMNLFERAGLWVMDRTVPGLTVSGAGIRVKASDNRAALLALSRDPLTLHATRWDAINGLVRLMTEAQQDAARLPADTLLLYGGKDQLVPKRAIRATWERLPPGRPGGAGSGAGGGRGEAIGPRIAYYPGAYHLMLRDLGRAVPIGDILAWMFHPRAPLPSGAGRAARAWLARR